MENIQSSIKEQLKRSRFQIENFNREVDLTVQDNNNQIAALKSQNKKLRRSKIRSGFLLSLLIRLLK